MMKFLKYRITFERSPMKTWRGVPVPAHLYVRLHYEGGSRVWFYIYGPNILEWAKTIR